MRRILCVILGLLAGSASCAVAQTLNPIPTEVAGTGTPTRTGFTEVGGTPTASYVYVKTGHLVTLTVQIQGVTTVAATAGTSFFAGFPSWTLAGGAASSTCAGASNNTTGVAYGSGQFNGNFFMPTWSATANIVVATCTFQTTN